MIVTEKRNHSRCQTDAAISFSYFNRSQKFTAVARNFGYAGMYFETDQAIEPGVILIIRSEPCHRSSTAQGLSSIYCSNEFPYDSACRQLKNMVTAQVKRCIRIDGDNHRFGVAVEYVRPSV